MVPFVGSSGDVQPRSSSLHLQVSRLTPAEKTSENLIFIDDESGEAIA